MPGGRWRGGFAGGRRSPSPFIVELLAEGWSEAEVLDNYPGITREDIRACLAYAAALLETERVDPIEIHA